MTFAEVMEEALYGPVGYYRRARPAIGPEGDFVTGSSLSPLFGETTARLLARLDAALGRPADYLEVGYGGGQHLAAVRAADRSPGRRYLAWDRIGRPVPAGVERLAGLDALAARSIHGLVFSYELFDAQPVHRLVGTADGLGELWVELAGGEPVWRLGELSDAGLAELLSVPLAAGQIADLAPGWRPLYHTLAELLGRGLLVTCDYGFEHRSLLDRRVRAHGTLAAYHRHRVDRQVLAGLGERDLTAHVDFSALIAEGEAVGLATLALTRQAPWLAAMGLLEGLERRPAAARVAAMELLRLDGMGEEIRVLVQARGLAADRVQGLADIATAG